MGDPDGMRLTTALLPLADTFAAVGRQVDAPRIAPPAPGHAIAPQADPWASSGPWACGRKSVPRRLLHPCRRQRELPLDLAAVEAVVELHVVPAANSQVSGNVVIEMTARKVHAAHVRTVRENVGEARA